MSAKQRRPSPILRFRDGELHRVASLAQAAGLGVIRFHDQVIGLDLRMPDHLTPREHRRARNVVGFEAGEPVLRGPIPQNGLGQLQAFALEALSALRGPETFVVQYVHPVGGACAKLSHSLF